METITMINGNKQEYTLPLPVIVIQDKFINDMALAHIKENTGLEFTRAVWRGYEAQPTESSQIAALFLTYNFKTRYYDNGSCKNTLFLKSDHHIGFDIESVCYDCLKRNNVRTTTLQPGDLLAC